jgi:ribosome biogenesis GTPase
MKLSDIGFDSWFENYARTLNQPERHIARVTAVDRDAWLIRNEHDEIPAELAGKYRYSTLSSIDMPCVGDWVSVQYHNMHSAAIIHDVFPRRTFLCRKSSGKNVDYQIIAANIDVAFIVQSCHYDFNIRRIDRYIVMVNEGYMKPIIILSKVDLVTSDELERIITQIKLAGITAEILALSNITGVGVNEFRQHLVPCRTYCLLGSSGVGKTTLINRLIGQDVFATKVVSETGEGTHATARRQLILLEQGAMLIDTPGMRELGILGADDGIKESFTDIYYLSLSCRFSNCTHTQEPGCAILKSIETGDLSEERYQSYLKLKKESEYHEMSYIEKRKKDRAFGRFIKSVQKHKNKRTN